MVVAREAPERAAPMWHRRRWWRRWLERVVAPPTLWTNVTADLFAKAAGGGDVTLVSAQPGTGRVIAGVSKKGLWATDDSGKTWVHLGSGAGSAVIDHGTTGIVYDPDKPTTFWESGIYGSTGGIFKTVDNGVTFTRLGNISHNDLVTVDFSDPERKTLLAGAHETTRKLYLSKDGGMTWNDIGMNLPADSNFSSSPQIIDTQTSCSDRVAMRPARAESSAAQTEAPAGRAPLPKAQSIEFSGPRRRRSGGSSSTTRVSSPAPTASRGRKPPPAPCRTCPARSPSSPTAAWSLSARTIFSPPPTANRGSRSAIPSPSRA